MLNHPMRSLAITYCGRRKWAICTVCFRFLDLTKNNNNNNKIEVVIVKLVKIVKLNKFATFSLFMFWSKIVISPKRIDLYPNG